MFPSLLHLDTYNTPDYCGGRHKENKSTPILYQEVMISISFWLAIAPSSVTGDKNKFSEACSLNALFYSLTVELTTIKTKKKTKQKKRGIAKPFLWRYGRVDFNTERNIDRSSTKSPVTWQAVASWYIMCSVLNDYKWFKKWKTSFLLYWATKL